MRRWPSERLARSSPALCRPRRMATWPGPLKVRGRSGGEDIGQQRSRTSPCSRKRYGTRSSFKLTSTPPRNESPDCETSTPLMLYLPASSWPYTQHTISPPALKQNSCMKPPSSFDTVPCHQPATAVDAAAADMASRSFRSSFASASLSTTPKAASQACAASNGRSSSFKACARLKWAFAQRGCSRAASSASDRAAAALPLLKRAWLRLLQ
mmetsp:Transcript_115070/g.330619  ORF Transcript_115070/g.330619 Transcript_115070/m.330619 type:complete len:211 (+) Transcript_115070:530-1162(+)